MPRRTTAGQKRPRGPKAGIGVAVTARGRGDRAPSEPSPSSGRGANGRFGPGNRTALTHGGRSSQVAGAWLPEQAAVRSALAEKRAAILADLGGDTQCSQLQLDLVDRYLELDTVASWLGGHLVAAGPLTAKGRARAALSAYLSVVDRAQRVAATLGLARRQKQVSLNQYLSDTYTKPGSSTP